MLKTWFNELDQWMIQNWAASRELEEAMNRVRQKYEQVFERVVEKVQERCPDLNVARVHISKFNGQVGFSNKAWPTEFVSWPTGIWISGVGLENLTARAGEAPCATIWFSQQKGRPSESLLRAKEEVNNVARKVFAGEKLKWRTDDPDVRTIGWYQMKESRQTILKMLLDRDGQDLVDCMTEHACRLAKFIPILDRILIKNR